MTAAASNAIEHLIEIRQRLLKIVIAAALFFLLIFPFAKAAYVFLAVPLLNVLPFASSLIATQVVAPFLIQLKLSFFLALILAMPVAFYQLWAFVAPGLYKQEKKILLPLVAASIILFYGGMAFAFKVVLPLALNFFVKQAPELVLVLPDVSNYLSFTMSMLLVFAFAFQVPLLTVALIRLGILSATSAAKARPYIVVAAFIIGMLLTPPDVISQLLLAIPMWLLFEVGLLMARVLPQPAAKTT